MKINFEQRYYKDAYLKTLETAVTACEAIKGTPPETAPDARYRLAFDETIFYPEGGGQPGDRGQILDAGHPSRTLSQILDTRYDREGRIWHYATDPIEPGTEVIQKLDWARRYDLMQQHSAEHLVLGLIKRRFGFENVGFHINEQITTLDTSGFFPRSELRWLTEAINEVIWADLPLQVTVNPTEHVKDVDYRSKIDLPDDVRLVHVRDVDLCACAGTHVDRTGELGQVRFIDHQRHRGGVRLTMLAGRRALDDAEALQEQALAVGEALAAPRLELLAATRDLQARYEESQNLTLQLTGRLFRRALPRRVDRPILGYVPSLIDDKALKYEIKQPELAEDGLLLLLHPGQDGKARFFLSAPDAERRDPVLEALKASFSAKGGGPPELTQGALELTGTDADEDPEALLRRVAEVLPSPDAWEAVVL